MEGFIDLLKQHYSIKYTIQIIIVIVIIGWFSWERVTTNLLYNYDVWMLFRYFEKLSKLSKSFPEELEDKDLPVKTFWHQLTGKLSLLNR